MKTSQCEWCLIRTVHRPRNARRSKEGGAILCQEIYFSLKYRVYSDPALFREALYGDGVSFGLISNQMS